MKIKSKISTVMFLPFRLFLSIRCNVLVMRPSQGFWGTGERGHLLQRNRGTKANFEGNRGKKTILGNSEHRKQFLGNMGISQFISGEQGNRYPLGRASVIVVVTQCCCCCVRVLHPINSLCHTEFEPRFTVSSERLEKPGIELTTAG